jgi:phosphotransferase system enzyme I (PtsI)
MTSHTTILARLLGIPAVVGVGTELLDLATGETVILDGGSGKLIAAPDESTLEAYRARQVEWLDARESSRAVAHLPAVTRDGHRVEVVANIGDAESAQSALEFGAEGVGLLRTEFVFLNRATMPDEEEQFRAYRAVADVMGNRPVVVRTLDIGGDKPLPYLDLGHEENPFLGWRAIRISLAKPDFFKIQLRAILRAGAGRNVKIMLPMIATKPEIQAAKQILEETRQELTQRGVEFAASCEFGIMVEIPAAAVAADLLAPEIDFFSIGTNDLTQYTLACDRGNTRVAGLYNHLHPAVLRLIRTVIEAAHPRGRWVGLCGELAGDLDAIPILIGLGLDEFSMSPGSIPAAKELIRKLDQATCRELASKALNLATPAEVRALVRGTAAPAASVLY